MGDSVWLRICTVAPLNPEGGPSGCAWTAVPAANLQADGLTKEQYDALFGAVITIIVTVIIIAIIKKAIEQ